MAPLAGLVAESEVKRLRSCAAENETLSRCWEKPHVALVVVEWAPCGLAYQWKGWIARNEVMGYWDKREAMPVLSVDVIPPQTLARSGSEEKKDPEQTERRSYRFWLRSSWPQDVIRSRESAWRTMSLDNIESTFIWPNEVAKTLGKLFHELSSAHPTICVCSHRPSLTQRGLAEIGFQIPKDAIFVDLIKVLEYQSRFCDTPQALKGYVNNCLNVDKRHGSRLDEKLAAYDGDALARDFEEHAPKNGQNNEWREVIRKKEDVSAHAMLKILGPEAEVHRRQIDKLQKEMSALERATKGLGSEEAKKTKRNVQRELQKRDV